MAHRPTAETYSDNSDHTDQSYGGDQVNNYSFGILSDLALRRGDGLIGVTDVAASKSSASMPKASDAEVSSSATIASSTPTLELYGQVSGAPNANPSELDVLQGGLGDCYVMATIGALAEASPSAVENMIQDNGNGTYTVNMFTTNWTTGGTEAVTETVYANAFGSIYNANSARPAVAVNGDYVVWTLVLEQAVAEVLGGLSGTNSDGTENVTAIEADYSAIDSGGEPALALQAFTGDGGNGFTFSNQMSPGINAVALLQSLQQAGDTVTFATDTQTSYNLLPGHAYTFMGLTTIGGQTYVELANPWGIVDGGTSNGIDDGSVWGSEPDLMTLTQFCSQDLGINYSSSPLAGSASNIPPIVTKITMSQTTSGVVNEELIVITLAWDAPVTIENGATISLALSNGGAASYLSGSGTADLKFGYKIPLGQNVSSLDVLGINLGNSPGDSNVGIPSNDPYYNPLDSYNLYGANGQAASTYLGDVAQPGLPALPTAVPNAPVVTSEVATSVDQATIYGKAQAGSIVSLWKYDVLCNTTTAASNGTFSINTGRTRGVNQFTLTASDTVDGDPATSNYSANVELDDASPGRTFYLDEANVGTVVITGFDTTSNVLDFNQPSFTSFAAIMKDAAQVGTNTVITIDSADTVTLVGVSKNSLTSSDFNVIPEAPAFSPTLASNNTVTLEGIADPFSQEVITIRDNGVIIGQTTLDPLEVREWSFTTGMLAEGVNNFTATASRRNGFVSSPSNEVTVDVPTLAAPSVPVVGFMVATGTGLTLNGTVANAPAATSGAPTGTIVTIDDTVDGITKDIGTAPVNSSDAWSANIDTSNLSGVNLFTETASFDGLTSASSTASDELIVGTTGDESFTAPNVPDYTVIVSGKDSAVKVGAAGDVLTLGGTSNSAKITAGSGTATISGTDALLEITGASTENAIFTSTATGTLKLDTPSGFAGTVAGLADGDAIDLTNFLFSGNPFISSVSGNETTGEDTYITLQDGASSITLTLLNQYSFQFPNNPYLYSLSADGTDKATAGTLFQLAPLLPPPVAPVCENMALTAGGLTLSGTVPGAPPGTVVEINDATSPSSTINLASVALGSGDTWSATLNTSELSGANFFTEIAVNLQGAASASSTEGDELIVGTASSGSFTVPNTPDYSVIIEGENTVVAIGAAGDTITLSGSHDVATVAASTGTATIGAGINTLILTAKSAESVTFKSTVSGTLTLEAPTGFTGTVAGMETGDQIDLTSFLFSGTPTISKVTGTGAINTATDVTVTDGSASVTLALLNQYANQFAVSSSAYTLAADSTSKTAGTFFELAAAH